jgi:predicted NodU family carbamoyl transferase
MDLAASVQAVTEEVVLKLARTVARKPANRTSALLAGWP